MNLKIGDKVRRINGENEGFYPGETGIIYMLDGNIYKVIRDRDGVLCEGDVCNLELIENNNTTMNLKEKFCLAFKSEPEKTFRKAGITNGDDYLTDDGQKIFLSWLLKQHGEKFKTEVVDTLLADCKDCEEGTCK